MLACVLIFGFALPPGTTRAEMPGKAVMNILAIVNEDPISIYDLNQRLDLIIRSSTLPNTAEARRRLAPRVLQALISETLQLQEAKRLNVRVTDREMKRALELVEKQNRLPPGKMFPFLKSRGIGKETLLRQIRAALAWQTVVRQRYGHSIIITNAEIEKTLERFKKNAEKPRHLVAEIFLPVDNPVHEQKIKNTANSIINEIKNGAQFAFLARQFSQSVSATQGGDLGWVQPGQLDPKIEEVLNALPERALSRPIRTTAGYTIVLLRKRRVPQGRKATDATVSLRQIVLQARPGDGPDAIKNLRELAGTIRQTISGCPDFVTLGRELGIKMPKNAIKAKVSELSKELRALVSGLDIGAVSPPMTSARALKLIMVCAKSRPNDANLPSQNGIRTLLLGRRLEVRARRYLSDLRQSAFLDIRAWR